MGTFSEISVVRIMLFEKEFLLSLRACTRGINIINIKYMAGKDERWRMHSFIVKKKKKRRQKTLIFLGNLQM